MNIPRLCLALSLLSSAACQPTEECTKLQTLKGRYEVVANQMRARAGLREQALERARISEERAQALLTKLGLDKTETELDAILKQRAQTLGVSVERGTREVALGESEGATEKQTLWSFELSAKDAAAAVDQARTLAGSPPLFRYVALLGDGKTWRFRMAATQIDQMNLDDLKPVPPPTRQDPADIESNFGFCGASGLRADIAKLEAEIVSLEPKAAETTIAMPKSASWAGLNQRVLAVQAEEAEARLVLDTLMSAAVKGRVEIKAAGVEGAVVILELRGGPAERQRFQSQLSEKFLEALRPGDGQRPGVIRYMMANRAARRKLEGGPGQEGSRP